MQPLSDALLGIGAGCWLIATVIGRFLRPSIWTHRTTQQVLSLWTFGTLLVVIGVVGLLSGDSLGVFASGFSLFVMALVIELLWLWPSAHRSIAVHHTKTISASSNAIFHRVADRRNIRSVPGIHDVTLLTDEPLGANTVFRVRLQDGRRFRERDELVIRYIPDREVCFDGTDGLNIAIRISPRSDLQAEVAMTLTFTASRLQATNGAMLFRRRSKVRRSLEEAITSSFQRLGEALEPSS